MKDFLRLLFQIKAIVGVIIAVVIVVVVVKGCRNKPPEPNGGGNTPKPRGVQLHPISGTENPERRGDVIFIHGLDGNHQSTWESNDEPPFFFPNELGEQFKDIGVWSVEYAANSSAWYGGSMPIEDRSLNLLKLFEVRGIGNKPIIFVTHSLGGLMAKQVVVDSFDMKFEDWKGMSQNIKGVVFLATPHNGSSISNYLKLLAKYFKEAELYRTTEQVQQLERNAFQCALPQGQLRPSSFALLDIGRQRWTGSRDFVNRSISITNRLKSNVRYTYGKYCAQCAGHRHRRPTRVGARRR